MRLVDEQLRESLRSYNTHPDFYAQRYRAVDMSRYRATFLHALPDPLGRVLDGGCGPGRDCADFRESGVAVVGLDLSMGLLTAARTHSPGARFVNADLRALPFHDGSFDGVWLCSSLVHLPTKVTGIVLRRVWNVLRTDGILFASVIDGTDPGWRNDQFNGRRWFQPFTEADFVGLVEAAGFSLISSSAEAGVSAGRWINVFAKRESGHR
jgi:SAM-dependent methyltransferase